MNQMLVCNTILKLKKAGKIFFIISHDIEFLYPIVDKVVIINKGIIECYGTFTECESKLNEYGYKYE
jgi:ABC-type multidrug transport system ATPase subunit